MLNLSTFNSLTVINTPGDEIKDQIREFYVEAFGHYDKDRKVPPISIEFYPYIGTNHTIRIRDGKVYVRIAEICHDMALEGQRALAYILVSKLYRRRVPKSANEVYSQCIKTDVIRERAAAIKKKKGRKVITSANGDIYDLVEIFDDVNTKYFGGTIEKPVLTWSARKTYRILGHHDAAHQTIVISKSLDSADTPRYIVEYVVFHEMLHIAHPTKHVKGRRYNHTPEFRRDERKFPHYRAAENWIEKNVNRLRRAARRR